MSDVKPIVAGAEDGEHLWYDGGLLTFKATGEQTGGSLLLFEVLMPRGKATPMGTHETTETMRVLEGRIRMHIDGAEYPGEPGGVFMIPPDTPHAFVVDSETVRLLVAFTPADAASETFFRLAGEPAEAPALPPSGRGFDPERMREAAERSGMKLIGPPPFELIPERA